MPAWRCPAWRRWPPPTTARANSYTVEVTVAVFVDTDTATTTAEETESTNAAPAASIDAPTDDSNPH